MMMKKKSTISHWSYLTLLGLFFTIVSLVACDDDKVGTDPIVVSTIYLQDVNSTVQDRKVSFARLGQLLRIEGSGFMGLKKVYINGYETFFNTVYVSNNSMLIQISGDTPTTDADDSVRNTIRLLNDGNETIYSFEIRSEAPSITNISNTLPNPGEEITVYGTGLTEIDKVVFPGGIEVTTGITYDEDKEEFFTVTVPNGVSDNGGSLYVETANGG